MAFRDWTLKGFLLGVYIAGFTSWLVAAGVATDIKYERIKKEQENRAKTALIQPAPTSDKSEEVLISIATGKPIENPGQRANISRVNEYSYLDTYDSIIKKEVDNFNKRLNPKSPLEYNLIKAMIKVEAGSIAERERAFKYDPMQIANQGDCALEVLVAGKENTRLIGDFSRLKDKKHTPRRNERWDYSNSNMTAEDGIYGGVGWLFHKAAVYKFVERGDVLEYEVQPGDNFSKIAKRYETAVSVLRKYNPQIVPEKLQIRQKLRFRQGDMKVTGWLSWKDAVRDYNGGGDPDYIQKVYAVKAELDNLDKLNN